MAPDPGAASASGALSQTRKRADYGYDREHLPDMIALAARQRAKDEIFVDLLARQLRPGPVLEIGAGCGQIAEMLAERGWSVVASDIEPFFVEYMRSRGLDARVLDALDLPPQPVPPMNVVTTGLSPLIHHDEEAIHRAYRSIARVLAPGGRFVFIHPSPIVHNPWSPASTHIRVAEAEGLRLVRRIRNQALPSTAYAHLPRSLSEMIEASLGRLVGVRWVLVFERPQRPSAG